MTLQKYREYQERVDHYLSGLIHVSTGPCPNCADCGLEDVEDMNCEKYELAGEGGFSWSPCEICNSPLGGNRYPVHAVNPDDDSVVHMTGCANCVYFLEYGRLDDLTMEGIKP